MSEYKTQISLVRFPIFLHTC